MNQPLVTIGVPAYNHEKYIGDCINSIIDQPYDNIELIIINDGSTDNTHHIIKSYEKKCKERFTRFVYINRENKGLAKTANEILNLAQGKYFKLLASDDKLHIESIKPFVKELEKGYDIVYGKLILISENNVEIKEINGLFGIGFNYSIESFNICDALLAPQISGSPWIIRTDILKSIGGFDEKSPIEDWELLCRVLVKGLKKNFIEKVSAYYRVSEKRKPYLGSYFNWLKADLYILEKYKSFCIPAYKQGVKNLFKRNLILSRDDSLKDFLDIVFFQARNYPFSLSIFLNLPFIIRLILGGRSMLYRVLKKFFSR